jgi:hypothetical protein
MNRPGAIFRRRKHAYERLFKLADCAPTGDARTVLADLKRFARLPDAPVARSALSGQTDALATGVMIGRQEVVNRILAHLHIDERAFFNLKDETDD